MQRASSKPASKVAAGGKPPHKGLIALLCALIAAALAGVGYLALPCRDCGSDCQCEPLCPCSRERDGSQRSAVEAMGSDWPEGDGKVVPLGDGGLALVPNKAGGKLVVVPSGGTPKVVLPVGPPAPRLEPQPVVDTSTHWARGGVIWFPTPEAQPRYRINGKDVSRQEAVTAIGQPPALHLTIFGPKAEREQVLADLHSSPKFAPWKGRCAIQGYEPNDPIITGLGFKTDGRPTVYLQLPSGKVLHRQDVYQGPDHLAEALRKADPNYKPEEDPDATRLRNRPILPSLPSLPGGVSKEVGVLGGLGLLLLLLGRRGGGEGGGK